MGETREQVRVSFMNDGAHEGSKLVMLKDEALLRFTMKLVAVREKYRFYAMFVSDLYLCRAFVKIVCFKCF